MLKLLGFSKIWLLAGAVGVIIVIGGIIYMTGKQDGKAQSETKAAVETVIRIDSGAKASTEARKAQREGRTPEAGVRSRDGAWE